MAICPTLIFTLNRRSGTRRHEIYSMSKSIKVILVIVIILGLIGWGTIQTQRLFTHEKTAIERIQGLQDSLKRAARIDSMHIAIERWDSLAMNSFATLVSQAESPQYAGAHVGIALQLDYRDSLLRALTDMRQQVVK